MIILYFPEILLSPSLSKYFLSRLPMESVKNVLKLPMKSVKNVLKLPMESVKIVLKLPMESVKNVLKLPMESVILNHQKREAGAQ